MNVCSPGLCPGDQTVWRNSPRTDAFLPECINTTASRSLSRSPPRTKMAMIPRSAMRIIALPLMRPSVNANASSFGKLPTFYSYKIIAPPPIRKPPASRTFLTRWMPEEGLGKWASHKVSRTWTNFGMAGEGTLKVCHTPFRTNESQAPC